MIDAHSEVIEIHQENYQDLISTHSIYGRCDPLFHRIALHLGVWFQNLNIRGNSQIRHFVHLTPMQTHFRTICTIYSLIRKSISYWSELSFKSVRC